MKIIALLALLIVADPGADKLWLKTDSKWVRTDSYGLDRNHNGRIDDDEWVEVRSAGNSRQAQPWNQPVRPLQDGETHRWTVEWDESYESAPRKIKPKS